MLEEEKLQKRREEEMNQRRLMVGTGSRLCTLCLKMILKKSTTFLFVPYNSIDVWFKMWTGTIDSETLFLLN